jgi:hypothetical protein
MLKISLFVPLHMFAIDWLRNATLALLILYLTAVFISDHKYSSLFIPLLFL